MRSSRSRAGNDTLLSVGSFNRATAERYGTQRPDNIQNGQMGSPAAVPAARAGARLGGGAAPDGGVGGAAVPTGRVAGGAGLSSQVGRRQTSLGVRSRGGTP